jgi:hypothetical protein
MILPVHGATGADKDQVVQTVQIVQPLLYLPRVQGKREPENGLDGAQRLNGLNVLNGCHGRQRVAAKITASSSGATTSSWS